MVSDMATVKRGCVRVSDSAFNGYLEISVPRHIVKIHRTEAADLSDALIELLSDASVS